MARLLTPEAGRQLESLVGRVRRRLVLDRLVGRLPAAGWAAAVALALLAVLKTATAWAATMGLVIGLAALSFLAVLATALRGIPDASAAARRADRWLAAGSALESAYSVHRSDPRRLPAGATVLASRVTAALPSWRRQALPQTPALPGHAYAALGLGLAALLVVVSPGAGDVGLNMVVEPPPKSAAPDPVSRTADADPAGPTLSVDTASAAPSSRRKSPGEPAASGTAGDLAGTTSLASTPGQGTRPSRSVAGADDAGGALPARQRPETPWNLPATGADPGGTEAVTAAGGRAPAPAPPGGATHAPAHPADGPAMPAPSPDYEPLLPPPVNAYAARYFQRLRDEPDGG